MDFMLTLIIKPFKEMYVLEVKNINCGDRQTWIQILALPFTTGVTLGKMVSEAQISKLETRIFPTPGSCCSLNV